MRPTWLKWIELEDGVQLDWITHYLARQGHPNFSPTDGHSLDGVALLNSMAYYENDPGFRRVVDRMRAAWRQRCYRKRNGQQVAFQLPYQVRNDLKHLAKVRGLTKVEALRQIISEAACQQYQEKEAARKARKERQELKVKHEKMAGVYNRSIKHLLETLAEEIHQRCRLQALLGDLADEPLYEEQISNYTALIDRRRKEVKAAQPDLKLVRPGFSIFDKRLESLAGELGPSHPTRSTQDLEQEPPQ